MAEFSCEQCGKRFRWTAALAGRRAKCPCGSTIICPENPPQDFPEPSALFPGDPEDYGEYELATDPKRGGAMHVDRSPDNSSHDGPAAELSRQSPERQQSATAGVAPVLPVLAQATAGESLSPPAPAPLAYRSAQVDPLPADPEALKTFYMPLWLLLGGVVVNFAAALLQGRNLEMALKTVGAQLIFGTMLMLVGVLVAVQARGINLGKFWIAVFKLAAISVAPSALVALASPALNQVFMGSIIGWVIEFILYFALLGALFDLDESDTWYVICVIFVVNAAVYFINLASPIKLF